MPIQTQCTWCGKKINAGDSFAGKSVKCPGCGGVIKIPHADGPALAPGQAPSQFGGQPPIGPPGQPPIGPPSFGAPQPPAGPPIGPPAGGIYDVEDISGAPAMPQSSDPSRRPCPACGEMILKDAAKCRFCGEVFDGTLARSGRKSSKDDDDMTVVDWLLAIFCGGIGCIVAIVYLVQGKKKGGKMLGITIAISIGWQIISFILQEIAKQR